MRISRISNIYNYKNPIKQRSVNHTSSGFIENEKARLSNPFMYRIIPFMGKRCSEHNFLVKDIANIRCPVCGLITLTDGQIRSFIVDISTKQGVDLKEAFEKYEDESIFTGAENPEKKGIYRIHKQDVVDILKELAVEHPDLSLAQLVKLKSNQCIDTLVENQVEIINQIRLYVTGNIDDNESIKALYNILDQHEKRARGEDEEGFANKKFVYELKKCLNDTGCDYALKDMVLEIADKLPTSKNNVSSFFVKYAKPQYSSSDIASKFVVESIPTAEHLIPKSNQGPDKLKNYICDCADCNSRRSSTPFYVWQADIPDFESNLQSYLQDVQNAIDSGKLGKGYIDYVENIIEVLYKLSEGDIDLKLPDSKNQGIIDETLEKREKAIESIEEFLNNLSIKIESIKQRLASLEQEPNYRWIIQEKIIGDKIADMQNQISSSNVKIHNLKEQKDEIQKQLSMLTTKSKHNKQKKNIYTQIKGEYTETKRNLDKVIMEIHAEEIRQSSYNKKMEELKEKETVIKRNIPTKDALNSKIMRQERVLSAISELENEKNKLEDTKTSIAKLRAEIDSLTSQMNMMQGQNDMIEKDPSFNRYNRTLYNEYEHQIKLLRNSEEIFGSYASNSSKKLNVKEIRDITKIAINANIDRLKNLNEVIYFINIEEIKVISSRLSILNKKLKELVNQRRLLNETIVELTKVGSGRDYDEIQADIDKLIADRNKLSEILEVPRLKEELDMLENTYEYNHSILSQLSHYEIMSNEEFKQLISATYCDAENFI